MFVTWNDLFQFCTVILTVILLVFSTQRGNLKLLAIAAPHQSRQNIGSEMPIFHRDSFPPGEAKGRLRKLAPFNVPICSGNSGWLGIPIIHKLFTPAIVLPNYFIFLQFVKFCATLFPVLPAPR